MNIQHKRSLGFLRQAKKTKPKSPDCLGTIHLQKHTLDALVEQFSDQDDGELVANLAGWKNHDENGQYLTVEISAKYQRRVPKSSEEMFSMFSDENE